MLNIPIIRLQTILTEYDALSEYFKSAIKAIFNGESDLFEVIDVKANTLITDDNRNNLARLSACKEKTGIYVFLNREDQPLYVGKGGTSRNNDGNAKDLSYRISQELRGYNGNSQNTLSKNIMDVDSILYDKQITMEDSINKIKNMKIRILVTGSRLENGTVNIDMIKKVEALETILIALLPAIYNK